jgi:hypothetical protein
MTRDEVIERIQGQRQQLAALGVRKLSLFGSMARDEAGPDSDVDLLVEFEAKATFDGYMDVKILLEDLLGRRVDLGTESALRPEVRPEVEKELLRVA